MTDKGPSVLRETDAEARKEARELIISARFAAIAVIDPASGYPNSSRVLTATDGAGTPMILASQLAAHTKALFASPRCSLLIGEPGKGDPLAWPRISLQCDAVPIAADDPERPYLRMRFLRRHPKAALYIDFPDFLFFRIAPVSASLNGGFGRAFFLTATDLALPPHLAPLTEAEEKEVVQSLDSLAAVPAGFRLAALDRTCLVMESKLGQRLVAWSTN